MKKNLRYVVMSALMLISGSMFAQGVTIDFDTDYATLFPNLAGVSSNESHDGDFTGATTSTAVSGYTVTVTPADDAKTPSRIWGSSPRLRMYSGTFTVSGSNITNIEFNTGTNFNISGVNTGELSGKVWTGSANEVVFTIEKNTQLKSITINGSAQPEPEPQPVETTGQGTLESPYTCADAIAVANALGAGNTSSDKFYIKGKISTITYQFDVEHGTATFNISDNGQAANEFTCYGVYYLENKSWVEGNKQIAVGDEVIVYGNITLYNTTAETASKKAYIYSLNGQTKNEVQPEPVHFTGNGTQSNPYLVSDVRQMTEDIYPADYVWVKGVIIGSANSKTALHAGTAEDADVASNIAIAVSATDTDFTPVQLAANSDFRAKLNVLDNPANKGKEVLICGKIANYFSTAGVKELQTVIFNGETITGITTVKADAIDVNAPAYNIAGQRVNQGYRGLVIKGGKKVINK
jgi:hypothetical protein